MKERLKQMRKALGITQVKLSNALNVSKGAIANYETGRNEPIDAVITLICQKYNISEEWLRTGAGEMFVSEPKDELDELFDQYNLTSNYRVVLRELFSLPEPQQDEAVKFIMRVATMLAADEPEEDPIEAEIEAYRQELLAEKEAAEKPSVFAESVG